MRIKSESNVDHVIKNNNFKINNRFKIGLNGNNGFTLMELMIVIAIIGVIVLVAYPNFSGNKKDSALYGEARKVMTDIRYTQQLATNVRQSCTMNFNTTGYSIQYGAAPIKTDKSITFENSVTYIIGGPIVINSDGTIAGSGQTINFRKGQNSNIYLKIDNAGRVSIEWQ